MMPHYYISKSLYIICWYWALFQKMDTRSFGEYFEGWEVQQSVEEEEEELRHLVQQVLSHYQEYYDEKSKAAESDVFIMFSPPCFSSFERTLLWASGFKPSIAFHLLRQSVGNELTEDQNEKISAVKEETRRMERDISLALAVVHTARRLRRYFQARAICVL